MVKYQAILLLLPKIIGKGPIKITPPPLTCPPDVAPLNIEIKTPIKAKMKPMMNNANPTRNNTFGVN